MTMPTSYASFLVRLWCESCPEQAGLSNGWRGEVQHIQSGRCRSFDSLEDVLDFLRRRGEDSGPLIVADEGTASNVPVRDLPKEE